MSFTLTPLQESEHRLCSVCIRACTVYKAVALHVEKAAFKLEGRDGDTAYVCRTHLIEGTRAVRPIQRQPTPSVRLFAVWLYRDATIEVYDQDALKYEPHQLKAANGWLVEATSRDNALAIVMLRMHDELMQPHQSIHPPCDRPHVDELPNRAVERHTLSAEHIADCGACRDRMRNL